MGHSFFLTTFIGELGPRDANPNLPATTHPFYEYCIIQIGMPLKSKSSKNIPIARDMSITVPQSDVALYSSDINLLSMKLENSICGPSLMSTECPVITLRLPEEGCDLSTNAVRFRIQELAWALAALTVEAGFKCIKNIQCFCSFLKVKPPMSNVNESRS